MKQLSSHVILLFLLLGLYPQRGYTQSAVNYVEMFPLFDYITIPVDPENWHLAFVSKNYKVPIDFRPPALGTLKESTSKMDARVVPYYDAMYDAAKADGITLIPGRGSYRTPKGSERIFNEAVQKSIDEDGMTPEAAVRKAAGGRAYPGSSEHNLGLAVDFLTEGRTVVRFENTPEFAWLVKNAADYGFILRFPKGKRPITGTNYEPWHWRYVGVETAKVLKGLGVTFNEYMGKPFLSPEKAEEMKKQGICVEEFLRKQGR